MNTDEGDMAKIELEIPEIYLRKIQAICELEEISQDEWLKEAIADGIVRETTALYDNNVEAKIKILKEIVKGAKAVIEEYEKHKED